MSRVENFRATRAARKSAIPDRTLFLSQSDLRDTLASAYGPKGINLHSEKNLPLKPEIMAHTKWMPPHSTWAERIFCIINEIKFIPECKNCGNKTGFAQRNIGYHEYCSRKCSAESDKTKIRRAETNILRYADPVAFRNPIVKAKQQETLRSRYGVSNSYHLAKDRGAYSKISQELFWNIWSNSKQYGEQFFAELNHELRIIIDGQLFKPDFCQIDNDDKRLIEFDGDYWHGSETAKQKDSERDALLMNAGWKILRISESEYSKDKLEIISKCISFLNKQVD